MQVQYRTGSGLTQATRVESVFAFFHSLTTGFSSSSLPDVLCRLIAVLCDRGVLKAADVNRLVPALASVNGVTVTDLLPDDAVDKPRVEHSITVDPLETKVIECPDCLGQGWKLLHAPGVRAEKRKCDRCKGTGRVDVGNKGGYGPLRDPAFEKSVSEAVAAEITKPAPRIGLGRYLTRVGQAATVEELALPSGSNHPYLGRVDGVAYKVFWAADGTAYKDPETLSIDPSMPLREFPVSDRRTADAPRRVRQVDTENTSDPEAAARIAAYERHLTVDADAPLPAGDPEGFRGEDYPSDPLPAPPPPKIGRPLMVPETPPARPSLEEAQAAAREAAKPAPAARTEPAEGEVGSMTRFTCSACGARLRLTAPGQPFRCDNPRCPCGKGEAYTLAKTPPDLLPDRRNYDLRSDGSLWICDGDHDRSAPCEWRRAGPDDTKGFNDVENAPGHKSDTDVTVPAGPADTALDELFDGLRRDFDSEDDPAQGREHVRGRLRNFLAEYRRSLDVTPAAK